MGGSACQQSAPSVNTNTSEEKGSISSLSVHDLCSSIKPLTRTGSYHVHSHRHRPHYLLFFSMKVKCLLYQNIHLKQNAFPYQPLQMQLRKQQLCAKTLISQHPGFHYFSLFTDVCTAVEHFLYQEGPLWYILPAWVQFTYCNGKDIVCLYHWWTPVWQIRSLPKHCLEWVHKSFLVIPNTVTMSFGQCCCV